MKRRFEVASLTAEACRSLPAIGPLPGHEGAGSLFRGITSEGARFGFAAADSRTLSLLEAVWGKDAGSPFAGADARITCAPAGGSCGRFVDPIAGRQLLAFDYAPFTLIKQALRWEYGRQSPDTDLIPVHGVVIEAQGRRVCVSARGQAGKSFLADAWLAMDAGAHVLVDDWSLLQAGTRRIRRTGDAALHVRGTAFDRGSVQLENAEPVLVELCEGDPRSDESRYLVDRGGLRRFANGSEPRTLDALVLLREPQADDFEVRDDAAAVRQAFEEEASTFWDDSLIGLPAEAIAYLREAWARLLTSIPVVVIRGHRGEDARTVVDALREAAGPVERA